jgi:hypothetical protein
VEPTKGSSRLISILELIKFDLNYGVMDSMNRKVIVTGFRIISGGEIFFMEGRISLSSGEQLESKLS